MKYEQMTGVKTFVILVAHSPETDSFSILLSKL